MCTRGEQHLIGLIAQVALIATSEPCIWAFQATTATSAAQAVEEQPPHVAERPSSEHGSPHCLQQRCGAQQQVSTRGPVGAPAALCSSARHGPADGAGGGGKANQGTGVAVRKRVLHTCTVFGQCLQRRSGAAVAVGRWAEPCSGLQAAAGR